MFITPNNAIRNIQTHTGSILTENAEPQCAHGKQTNPLDFFEKNLCQEKKEKKQRDFLRLKDTKEI